MCETTNEKKWTLLELLETYNVQIPKIQRDYAQGRNSDKIKKIRQKFLRNIFDALVNDDSEMNLEFIYGSTDDQNTLFPLDGQQRLTTLFLLHWFGCVACVRDKQQLKWLRKFSYTTRHDAEMFCKLLTADESFKKIKEEYAKSKNKSCISDIIKNQPKFLSVYNSDPTASGMMVMLNAIQNQFQNNLVRLENLDNINFYFLPLEKFKLTDELYIKMNHRGKQLTEFEIFKVKIAECLQKADERKNIMALFDQNYADYFWSMYKKIFDDEILNFLRFAFFIDYYKNHGSFLKDYIIEADVSQEIIEEKHEEMSSQNKSDQKCFYDLFKEPESDKNTVSGKKEIFSNSDKLDYYILNSYKNSSYCDAQDILTTFMSHAVKEDCLKFFKRNENVENSDYVELFLPNQSQDDLLMRACRFDPNQRNNPFPYAEQIFMFALYLYYIERLEPEIFLKRFRILRNLVRNSENVREEFLAKWLEITENIIKTGELASDLRGGKICSAEMYDYEIGKSNLSKEEQELLAKAENHPAIHGFAIGFIAKDNASYSVKTKILQYFLEIIPADNATEQLKLLRKALLVCCDFSAPYSKDVQNVRLIPQNENIEDWRYFTIPTAQRQKNKFFYALEILCDEAGTDLEKYIENRLNHIPKNECYYFVKYADYIFPFGNYGYYCQGEKKSANVLLLKSSRWGDDNIRWNMHLYIINKIWHQKTTGKWFLQGDKNNSLVLCNHSTVSLVSYDDYFRLTSLDREHLLAALKVSANIAVSEFENSGGYYYDLAIPQNNGVDEVDRIEYLLEKLNL